MTMESRASVLLRALFAPRSVAVVGASDDPSKLSGRPVSYLLRHGYRGRVFCVNARRETVQGLPAYPALGAVPEPVDLAIVAVPAPLVAGVLRECAAVGVGVAMVYAAGFGEIGPDGAALQDEIAAICRETGLRVLGPNCLGTIGVGSATTATFASALDGTPLTFGPVALVTQSGAFGTFIFSAGQSSGVGFSHFANTGNEVDLTVPEIARALLDDDDVNVVLAYLEGLPSADAMREVARAAVRLDKPVVTVKVGRSPAGARAALAHTASAAGDDEAYDALTREHGLLRVHGMTELLDAARVFAAGRRAAGRRATIVTMSGGAGVLMADLLADQGVEVPEWGQPWRDRVAAAIPPFGSSRNPVDVTATLLSHPEILEASLAVAIDHPGTDCIAVLLGNAESAEEALVAAVRWAHERTTKPLVAVWTGGSGRPREDLTRAGVPVYPDPESAARALGLLVRWSVNGRAYSDEPKGAG